jgi:hypothetical protein
MTNKHYFVTYQATNRQGSVSVWNQVIDTTPMDFIQEVALTESTNSGTYRNFVVLNTLEISEEEYLKHKGMF